MGGSCCTWMKDQYYENKVVKTDTGMVSLNFIMFLWKQNINFNEVKTIQEFFVIKVVEFRGTDWKYTLKSQILVL